jgi:hypothetical protein
LPAPPGRPEKGEAVLVVAPLVEGEELAAEGEAEVPVGVALESVPAGAASDPPEHALMSRTAIVAVPMAVTALVRWRCSPDTSRPPLDATTSCGRAPRA